MSSHLLQHLNKLEHAIQHQSGANAAFIQLKTFLLDLDAEEPTPEPDEENEETDD